MYFRGTHQDIERDYYSIVGLFCQGCLRLLLEPILRTGARLPS